jgi:hypothetical protein
VITEETADRIVQGLIGAEFGKEHLPRQQVICLVEEAGEFNGAFRRWKGLARRSGTFEDVQAEAADIVITAYVTGAVLGLTIPPADDDPPEWIQRDELKVPDYLQVLRVPRVVNDFVEIFDFAVMHRQELPPSFGTYLTSIVEAVYRAARALDFDLDAAIDRKLEIVFARGWREPVQP